MRSVVLLRSRPGRPWWQLTTRPTTAAVLGLVSLVAACVQLVLLSSPTPWYQLAVAGFWALVGVAFLASAAWTRERRRRAAARARTRVSVDGMPFVPVPVRPARPRRREEPAPREGAVPLAGAGPREGAGPRVEPASRVESASSEVDTGQPTDDLADAVKTAANPVITVPPPVTASRPVPDPRPVPDLAPVPDPGELTTRLSREPRGTTNTPATDTRSRYAVRAVQSAEFAARELAQEAERVASERASAVAETVPLRDGRVRGRRGAHRGGRRGRTAGGAASLPAAAPDGTVPRPRGASEEPAPEVARVRHTSGGVDESLPRPRPRPASEDTGAGRGGGTRTTADPTSSDGRPASNVSAPSTGTRLTFGGGPPGPEVRPTPARGRVETGAPEPRDPSSGGRASRASDTGRHAKVGTSDRSGPTEAGTRRARHAASAPDGLP